MSNKPPKKGDLEKAHQTRTKKSSPYSIGSKKIGKPYLIICEGEVTEPIYFESIAGTNVQVTAKGYGSSKTALVDRAVKHCTDNEVDVSKTEVWVVFNFDVKYDQISNQKEDYNEAIRKARQLGFGVAYSNDCFELWLVLHLKDVQGEFHRKQLYEYLSKHLGEDYEALGKKRSRWLEKVSEWKSDLKADTKAAMIRAIGLDNMHSGKPFADQNPVTTIFQLAHELDPESYPLPQ